MAQSLPYIIEGDFTSAWCLSNIGPNALEQFYDSSAYEGQQCLSHKSLLLIRRNLLGLPSTEPSSTAGYRETDYLDPPITFHIHEHPYSLPTHETLERHDSTNLAASISRPTQRAAHDTIFHQLERVRLWDSLPKKFLHCSWASASSVVHPRSKIRSRKFSKLKAAKSRVWSGMVIRQLSHRSLGAARER